MGENIFSIVTILLSVLFYYGIYRLIQFILRGGLKFTRSKSPISVQKIIISEPNHENFIARVWNGNAGLAVIYWIYGVFAGLLWGIAFSLLAPAPDSGSAKLFLVCIAVYFIIVYVGIWRAASKYQGKKTWAVLAKFAAVLGALITVVPVVFGLLQSATV